MQTLDITFEKNYHTSLEDRFLMEKIIIHKSVDIGEDAQQVLDKARQEAELNHRRNNPHLYQDIKSITPSEVRDTYTKLYTEKTLEEQVASCLSIKTLESYKFIVKGKPDLETIYQSKLKELSHE